MSYSILDCTLRDGGYYNNWDFDPSVVAAYLKSMADAKIDYVELGLRNFSKDGFLGAFAYTTEEFLNSLGLPEGPTYGVMVDAKTILESGLTVAEAVSALFVKASDSRVGLVRVAAHFEEVEKSSQIITCLKQLGYTVGFNLMQAGGKPSELILAKVKQISSWSDLDVLYFADSLGNMDAAEVKRIYDVIRCAWEKPVGIHTHNNMGRGLDNTLAALDLGVTWLDATVTGMGRGAGNTQTELLLAHLDQSSARYSPSSVYELVIRYFESMQKDYGWGSNLLYFLGAQNDVHPSYIQNLLSNTHYGTDEVIGAIGYLSKLEGTTTYNGAVLDQALSFSNDSSTTEGSDQAKGLFDGKEILIVTNSETTGRYKEAVERYISTRNLVVISINTNACIAPQLIDYYAVSHNSKFLSESNLYKELDKPLILPKCRFTKEELAQLDGAEVVDYGLSISAGEFDAHGSSATIPYDITAAYVLALLLESNVTTISVVGFDGYVSDPARQQEMISILGLYKGHAGSKDLVALTPTTYPIVKKSIYDPFI